MAQRKQFSKQFKLQAIELLEQSGRQATEVARELGVRRNQLYKWQAEFQAKGEEQAFQGPGRPAAASEQSEIESLRREVAQLKEENAILKKAAAYFARELP
ncbi:transposase [uncultured Salinisphaera sp.]|uniref:transposase n=1 Tax=uncultured Salinisphaera sp. TaxID=359372 RepID=UPI0032B258BB|tara:strand:- start:4895 stop:5197 length:303 start_codon:yes stop_codon:yes gene_type:complete